jgi:hypothetical protein
MNAQLLHLLAEAGVSRPLTWRDVVILQNYGPVPVPAAWTGMPGLERGLNLLILDGTRPTHFCKCRSVNNTNLNRETLIRQSLAPVDAGLRVPPVTAAASDVLGVQVSRFLDGPHVGMLVPTQQTSRFVRSMERILCGLGALADYSIATLSAMTRPEGRGEHARVASLACLERLMPVLNLNGRTREAVAAVVDQAGTLPERPQHGDLWWRNIIRFDDHYWAIDLEEYGDIRVPLFDDLTLLISTLAIRHRDSAGGVRTLCGDSEEAAACRSVLARRAKSEGVAAEQLDAILACYVLTRASTIYFRSGPDYGTPHLRAARYVLERFERGDRGLLA